MLHATEMLLIGIEPLNGAPLFSVCQYRWYEHPRSAR